MSFALALLLIGGIALVAAVTGESVIDVALGRTGTGDQGDSSAGTASDPYASDVLPMDIIPPSGTQTFDGHIVANWIVPILKWARNSGYWNGTVQSGYRSHAEQKKLYDDWKAGKRTGPVAEPGSSNHEGTTYPRGAVDVTDDQGLVEAMKHYPGHPKLHWFGPGDRVHFSATGH